MHCSSQSRQCDAGCDARIQDLSQSHVAQPAHSRGQSTEMTHARRHQDVIQQSAFCVWEVHGDRVTGYVPMAPILREACRARFSQAAMTDMSVIASSPALTKHDCTSPKSPSMRPQACRSLTRHTKRRSAAYACEYGGRGGRQTRIYGRFSTYYERRKPRVDIKFFMRSFILSLATAELQKTSLISQDKKVGVLVKILKYCREHFKITEDI